MSEHVQGGPSPTPKGVWKITRVNSDVDTGPKTGRDQGKPLHGIVNPTSHPLGSGSQVDMGLVWVDMGVVILGVMLNKKNEVLKGCTVHSDRLKELGVWNIHETHGGIHVCSDVVSKFLDGICMGGRKAILFITGYAQGELDPTLNEVR